jgi:hypothetical protein
MGYCEEIDDEEHPRNAVAIRTALLMGAEFKQNRNGYWYIEGIACENNNKTMPAWLFLATHGICITKDARPCLCKDLHHEDIK